ncbi:MAG: TfoX/Sxy family protein [Proteobacteria bacterium]|nr:TfoX/Sxy family protein [Pseudomonadota bacterium]
MAEPFLRELRSLLERTSRSLGPAAAIECKHFFSGAAAYAGGVIFMSLTPAGLALKLPAEARQQLMEAGAKPLRYFPKAPVKKEYVILPETIVRDDDALAPWIEESIRYATAGAD